MYSKTIPTKPQMSDSIHTLPTDNDPLHPDDHTLIYELTSSVPDKNAFHLLMKDAKSILLAGILFAVLNYPTVDTILQDVLPYTRTSHAALVGMKTLVFVICIFIYTNIKYISK